MKINRLDITKKLTDLKEGQVLCVDIETGTTIYIEYDTLVTPYEAEVTLK